LNKKFNIQTILIAPLDWGLGHATRCIPIIQVLLQNNFTVIIAASGKQKILLQQEFPSLTFIDLRGYNISYAKNKFLLPCKILMQVPKILLAIRNEKKWLQFAIEKYKIDVVISDNRYGLHSTKIPCVFITHQLLVKMPFKWLENLAQKINYHFINKFSACWIPDFEGDKNIAGKLAHPSKMPSTAVSYIGLLSRFLKIEEVVMQYNYCIILSGPEPQRTILEDIIFAEINTLKENILLIRGKPDCNKTFKTPDNITIKNHLPGNEISKAMQESNFIICRSGYTTVMEFLSLHKKAILIPTPGQTEQEYLAKKLMQQQWCFSIEQKNFQLQKILADVKLFPFQQPQLTENNLQNKIVELLQNLTIAQD